EDGVPTTTVAPGTRSVRRRLRAQDVIHTFFVADLLLKHDAVPGMAIAVVLTPSRDGNFDIVCAALCGLGHYRMRATMKVVNDAEFQAWLVKHAPPQPGAQP